ncbi:uncharacterized protein LOC135499134 [Lineus longissimus]|uniref:uncharacterized protein LOC135499134 n=1 Tax=Lineus longissimus TaxID=88925 RepID=UPI002B4C6D6B
MWNTLFIVCVTMLCLYTEAAPLKDTQTSSDQNTPLDRDIKLLLCLTRPSSPGCSKDANLEMILDEISKLETAQSKKSLLSDINRFKDHRIRDSQPDIRSELTSAQKRPSFYSDWK